MLYVIPVLIVIDTFSMYNSNINYIFINHGGLQYDRKRETIN